VEITLRRIAENYFLSLDSNLKIFRMAIADSNQFPEGAHRVYREVIYKGNQALAEYLERQANAGVIRPLENPLLTARAFIGMLVTYVLHQEILGGKVLAPVSQDRWISEIVQVFLEGINPRPKEMQ
jgi:hypothetical protein